jgi:hypothetical protein
MHTEQTTRNSNTVDMLAEPEAQVNQEQTRFTGMVSDARDMSAHALLHYASGEPPSTSPLDV